jgi:hypothetical protein
MSSLAKAVVLGVSLLTGVTLNAYAQSDNVAALPPGTAPTAAAPIGPSGPYPGPDPGKMWSTQERQTRTVAPSPNKMDGPDPGKMWSTQESQTRPVEPSPSYVGPKPN